MLLSRFWYIVCALIIGALAALLFIAATLYNRAGDRAMREALAADSSAVHWYLKDDSRNRAAALIQIALNADVQTGLAKATSESKPSREVREKMKAALRKLEGDVPADLKFDALWAVDGNGRVIGAAGFDHGDDWELGGYPVVADALHGWIRDDAWVWKGRIYRVVARPVEKEAGSEPVGAIVGAKIVDDAFAKAVSKRTEAAVAFYAEGQRVASGAPEGFDRSNLDVITKDIKELEGNDDYQQKGRSEARVIGEHLGVVYARMPGEAWELGAGYAVGRLAVFVETPFDFFRRADNTDKGNVKLPILAAIVVAVAGLGLFFSWLEHSRPLGTFRHEVARLGKGEIDSLQPSRFRGIYKKVAADVNDGVEKVAVKGGAPRRAADLESVLGPLPAQPAMSAFSVPGGPGGAVPASEPSHDSQSFPRPVPGARNSGGGAPRLRSGPASNPAPPAGYGAPMAAEPSTGAPMDVALAPPMNVPAAAPMAAPTPPPAPSRAGGPPPPPRPRPPLPGQGTPPPVPAAPSTLSSAVHAPSTPGAAPEPVADRNAAGAPVDELTDWRRVYEEFLAVKKQCNEPVGALTFEKFQRTLQRNKDALVQHHGCERVRFTVYVKDGKAALKASPVK
jgi:hypothetical protein